MSPRSRVWRCSYKQLQGGKQKKLLSWCQINGAIGLKQWNRQCKQTLEITVMGLDQWEKWTEWNDAGKPTEIILFQNSNKIFTENLIHNCNIDENNKSSIFLVHVLTFQQASPSKLLFNWCKALKMLKYQHLPSSSLSSQTLHLLHSLFFQRDRGTIFWGTHSQESQRNPVFSHNAGTWPFPL